MYNKTNMINKIKMLYGDNISFSFPVPVEENSIKVEKYFVYRMSFGKEKTRPFIVVVVAMSDGTILEIENCHYRDFVTVSEYPFDKKISYELSDKDLSAKQMKELIEQANELYCTVRDLFFQDELSENNKAIISEYRNIVDRITPPALVPFYNALNPAFFCWLNADDKQ